MKIDNHCKVRLHYTLRSASGAVLNGLENAALEFSTGSGEVFPALESALLGHEVGEHLEITLSPEQGYGVRAEDAEREVHRCELAEIPNLQVGMPLCCETPQGMAMVYIKAMNEDFVTIDANHPLAGESLHFSLDIDEVSPAD